MCLVYYLVRSVHGGVVSLGASVCVYCVCMCVCVYVYVYVIYVYIYNIHTYIYIYIYMCICYDPIHNLIGFEAGRQL